MKRLFLIIVWTGLAVAGCGGHAGSTGAQSSSPPSAAAAATSPTPVQAVDAWVSAGGTTDMQALTAAFKSVAQAGDDPVAFAAACQQVPSAATKLQSDGPIQYQPAQTWLAKAIADTSKAASECQAMPSQAATDFGAAATDLTNLATAFRQAAARS